MKELRLLIFRKWAPATLQWSAWTKPVLFASLMEDDLRERDLPKLTIPEWISRVDPSTALIVDLPGESAIFESLALVKAGYWPVPLFNGCKAPGMVIDVSPLTNYLVAGAKLLENQAIRPDARPVFMLDSRRMDYRNSVQIGRFDNRWCILPQDMPSGTYLKESGIHTVLLISDKVREDLSHILYRYRKIGINILICKDGRQIEETTVLPPSNFKNISYRWNVLRGLRRNSTGGFGSIVPDPISSTGKGHRRISRSG